MCADEVEAPEARCECRLVILSVKTDAHLSAREIAGIVVCRMLGGLHWLKHGPWIHIACLENEVDRQ